MLPKAYDPKLVEETLAKLWQEKQVFKSQNNGGKKPYVIVIPPPNITGALHMGHGLNDTLQDVLIRYHRMRGFDANWVPGLDHGGIATQNVVEKMLAKEKKLSRHDLGREEFVSTVWQWYKDCGAAIYTQFEKMGWALDQSNIRFTMDGERADAVYECFKKLWDKKYIYRGKRLINWCVRCTTALSDIEVDHEQRSGKLWHLRYKGAEGGADIIIATTRPETIFADSAVAVNPGDEKYKNLVGKKVIIPLTQKAIPIIADEAVELGFGTGALKITPAHDATDYEVGARHGLEAISVITDKGRMVNVPAKYEGMDRDAAKKEIIKDLEEAGLLVKEEKYDNAVSTCYRCGNAIEPFLSEQWFVKMDNLAAPAIKAVESGAVQMHPESWKTPLLNWLKNIQDWCISRQIWWGHRIPVWYCRKCSGAGLTFAADKHGREQLVKVSFEDGAKPILSQTQPACPHCGGKDTVQDPDVLDTWFSSGLWPFSVFGWPKDTADLKHYYPTSVLVTGYEIIYLWVARMIMMGIEFMGRPPFPHVFLNGIVRDKTGKKMSKSLGNVVDPLDLIKKYGADATRFSLLMQAAPGKDIPYGEDSVVGARNFCNKIYNAARFIQMNLEGIEKLPPLPEKPADIFDGYIINYYRHCAANAAAAIEEYEFSKAAGKLYKFFWNDFCDWYIEIAKTRLNDNKENKEQILSILVNVLYGTLKALHPMMPFITDEIAAGFKKYIDGSQEFLINETYPAEGKYAAEYSATEEVTFLQDLITQVRTIRSQFNVHPAKNVDIFISSEDPGAERIINDYRRYINLLAKVENITLKDKNAPRPQKAATAVFGNTAVYIPLEGLIDFEKENARLAKELGVIETGIANRTRMLGNENFTKNAAPEQVAKAKEELAQMQLKSAQIKEAIAGLK